MPELPEVETVRAGLAEVVAGAKVTKNSAYQDLARSSGLGQ